MRRSILVNLMTFVETWMAYTPATVPDDPPGKLICIEFGVGIQSETGTAVNPPRV